MFSFFKILEVLKKKIERKINNFLIFSQETFVLQNTK